MCIHHYIVNQANHGVCKHCNSERDFEVPEYPDWSLMSVVEPAWEASTNISTKA